MWPALQVVNHEGTPFVVTLVHPGERYGRCRDGVPVLVNDGPHVLVEFYDASQKGDEGSPVEALGQFVARYRSDTLLTDYATGATTPDATGLDLCGHVPAWKLDGHAMAVVRRWLRGAL